MTTLNGTRARRYSTYGRAAGIGILVCAGALWAVPLPGMNELPAKPLPPAPPPAPEASPSAGAAAKIDADIIDGTAARLDLAWAHVEKPATVETKAPEEVHEEPAGPEWTYLGPIHESDRTLAIISVDGHQKILAEGRTFGDTKLIGVEADGISVEVNGKPKHIDRGQRSSSTVAWIRNLQSNNPAARIAGVPGQPVVPGGPGANLPPEVRARLAERGFPQDQGQNWRGRGGQGGGGNGGGNGGNGDRRNRGAPGGGDPRGSGGEVFQPTAMPVTIEPQSDAVIITKDGVSRSVN